MVAEGIASLALPEDSNRTVRLADFGCADGGPEMPLVHKIKSMLPKDCALEVCAPPDIEPHREYTRCARK
eukprot:1195653-Prorocentrum_minimum.AAC.3